MYASPVVPVPKDVPPITASGPDTATGVHPEPLLTGIFTLAASFHPAVVLVKNHTGLGFSRLLLTRSRFPDRPACWPQ